jgi:mRNA interferase MazF
MVKMTRSPHRGDIVWVSFTPQAGKEQAGRRPALIVSPDQYNKKSGLALICPITSRIKGYPFEVIIPQGLPIEGAILSDQVRSLDWKARNAEFICQLPDDAITEVVAKLEVLITG